MQENIKQLSEKNRLDMKVSMLEVRERNAKQKTEKLLLQMAEQEDLISKQDQQIL